MGSTLSLWGPPSLRLLGGGGAPQGHVAGEPQDTWASRIPSLLSEAQAPLGLGQLLVPPPNGGTPPRAGLQVAVHLLLHQPRRGIWDPAAKSSLGARCEIFR